MDSFEEIFLESTKMHGHVCPGQVIGVRLAMLGLQELEIDDPRGEDQNKLYVFVEIDRCATDAIQSVTGCSLGKRTLRLVDYGVMAATFVNLETGRAVRIVALEEARELSRKYFPEIPDKKHAQIEAYKKMPIDELYRIQEVQVHIPAHDLPGAPLSRVQCEKCGDWIQNNREIEHEMRILCSGCVKGRYYELL